MIKVVRLKYLLFLGLSFAGFQIKAEYKNFSYEECLMEAIQRSDVKTVKDILSKVKLSRSSKERFLEFAREIVSYRKQMISLAAFGKGFGPTKERNDHYELYSVISTASFLFLGYYFLEKKSGILAMLSFLTSITSGILARSFNIQGYELIYEDAVKIVDLIAKS